MTSDELPPVPSRVWRLGVLIPLWALALIGTTSWPQKLGFIVGTAFAFGTFRRFQVTTRSLRHRWAIAFVQLRAQKWKLRRFTRLQTQYEPATGILEFLFFGPLSFVYGWFMVTFFPWIGGAYRIWLNDESDQRILAWQGHSQACFERNLKLLQSRTGLPVSVR